MAVELENIKAETTVIKEPYVEACKEFFFKYYAEKPTTWYHMTYGDDNKYYEIKECPETVIMRGFKNVINTVGTLYQKYDEYGEKLQNCFKNIPDDVNEDSDIVKEVAIHMKGRNYIQAVALECLSRDFIDENNTELSAVKNLIFGKEAKFISKKYGWFIEIPLVEVEGAVQEFSKLLNLPEETVNFLSLFFMCNSSVINGAKNKKVMYRELFKYAKEHAGEEHTLRPEHIYSISKAFGDYDVVSQYSVEDDENEYFEKHFEDGLIEQYAKAETAEARRTIVEEHTEIKNILLGSIKSSTKAIPLFGEYKAGYEKYLPVTLNILRAKGAEVL